MIRPFLSSGFIFFGLISLIACSNSQVDDSEKIIAINEDTTQIVPLSSAVLPTLDNDTTIFIDFNDNSIEVIVKYPSEKEFKGTIIALPGWNFANEEWCDKTELCEKALAQGYALILPEMGKSIYCDSVFPETREDWLKYPTRSWMKEILIPNIQKEFQLLVSEQNNFVMGLSTGARGAVLLTLDLPDLFSACGALSGDYDQTRYTKDKLYNGFYGSFEKFTDRWLNNDNAVTFIQQLTVPVYIGHGEMDKIVPIAYSQQLFDELQKVGNTQSELNINPTAGHTYSFWNSEVDAVLEFFEKNWSK